MLGPISLLYCLVALTFTDESVKEKEPIYIGKTALIIMDMQESFMFDGNAYIKGAENLVDAINDIRKYFSHLFDVVIFTQEQHPMLHVSFYPTYHCMRPGDIVELNYTLDGRLCRQHPNVPKWTIPDEHTVECDLEKGTHILVQQELYEPHNIERVLSGKYSSKIVSRLTTDCCNDVIVVRGQYHHLDSASAFYEKLNNVPTTLQSELKQRNIDTLFLVGIAIDLGIIQTVQYAISQLNYEVYVVHDATVPYKRERLPMCEFTIPKMGAHLICMNDLYNIRPKKNVKEEKDKADKCGKCGKCPEGDTDKAAKDAKDAKESKDAKDAKESKDAKDAKESKDAKGSKGAKGAKDEL